MTHHDITDAADRLVADAKALHPTSIVAQAMSIVRRPDADADAYAKAITDLAFNTVFDAMTDAETQEWAISCLYNGNRNTVLHPRQALERAA